MNLEDLQKRVRRFNEVTWEMTLEYMAPVPHRGALSPAKHGQYLESTLRALTGFQRAG